MDKSQALEIISRYAPDLSLREALEMVTELDVTPELLTPKEWAEAVFSWNDFNTRKIGIIKEIRNRFGLGLRDAKDIADNLTPRAVDNFFPPREQRDEYGNII